MSVGTREMAERVLERLRSDPALAAYVRDFSIGRGEAARTFFPYVTVVEVASGSAPLRIGTGAGEAHEFEIVVRCGTRHAIADVAHTGGSAGTKGILQLVDDVVAALFPWRAEGALERPLTLRRASAAGEPGSGGRMWRGTVVLSKQSRQ